MNRIVVLGIAFSSRSLVSPCSVATHLPAFSAAETAMVQWQVPGGHHDRCSGRRCHSSCNGSCTMAATAVITPLQRSPLPW
jgi:hypothetical protein